MLMMTELDSGLLKSVREDRVHTLLDFLGRPTRMADGIWATTDAQNTELLRIDLPEDAILSDMYAEKMTGFLGFRAKAVVRIQINAQRYQQGRLLLHYFPQGQVNTFRRDVALQSLNLKTQMPRVELDCSTSTEAILEMPYVSPTTHYNLIDGTGPIGTFMMCVYSPLFAGGGGSNTVSWTAWVHFEDVDLSFPTITNLSALRAKRLETVYKAQGGVRRNAKRGKEGAGPELVEKDAMANMPVAFALSKVSEVATTLGDVPLLSSVAKVVSWAADVGSKIASAFGWSNPRTGESVMRMVGQRFAHGHNVDGLDQSVSIGLSSENKLEDLPGFAGTDIDEMSFDYIKKIPAFVDEFSWALTDVVDTEVWGVGVGPVTAGVARSVTTDAAPLSVVDFAPFAYVSQFFLNWRGSITYTFKVIKTEFHSGRLIVSFSPGNTVAPTTANRNYLYREIFDLRLSNEFKVTIPYVNTIPWTRFDATIGRLSVQVLNPLVAPDSVQNTVITLVEACGGPDFEVAIPYTVPNWTPVVTLPAAALAKKDDDVVFVAQGGEGAVEAERTATAQEAVEPIASSGINSGGLSSSRFCVGEAFTSLKQLMHRHTCWLSVRSAFQSATFRPGAMEVGYVQAGDAPVPSIFTPDYMSIFGSLYAYRRGSIRMRFHQMPSSSTAEKWDRAMTAYYYIDDFVANGTAAFDRPISTCAAFVIARDAATGGVEVELPHYGRVHTYINWCDTVDPIATDSIYRDVNVLRYASLETFSVSQLGAFRQTSDETHFGFFVGVLPLTTDSRILQTYTGNGNPFLYF